MKKTAGKTLIKWHINLIFKLWERELDGVVTRREKIQDMNNNQLKLEVRDTY